MSLKKENMVGSDVCSGNFNLPQSSHECKQKNKDQSYEDFPTTEAINTESSVKNIARKATIPCESSRNVKKRPDKPLYVPRALRSARTLHSQSDKASISKFCLTENESVPPVFSWHSSQSEPLPVENCLLKEILLSEICSSGNTETKLSEQYSQSVKENEIKGNSVILKSLVDDAKASSFLQEVHISEDITNSEKNSASVKDDNIRNSVENSIKCDIDFQNATEISPAINTVSSSLLRKNPQDLHHCVQKNEGISHGIYGASKGIIMKNYVKENTGGVENASQSGIDTVKNCLENLEPDSWDSLFNDDGECVHPEVIRELTSTVGISQIEFPHHDYSEFKQNVCSTDFDDNENNTTCVVESNEIGNIVELYGFPEAFTTQDLVSALSCFKSEHEIKWVDDCHALAIFTSDYAASLAVGLDHPFVKVRPISQGTKASKLKAKSCAKTVDPPKPRPATSVALARRLVSGALGLRVSVPKEERERERKLITDAKEKKRKAAKQRENIWHGVLD